MKIQNGMTFCEKKASFHQRRRLRQQKMRLLKWWSRQSQREMQVIIMYRYAQLLTSEQELHLYNYECCIKYLVGFIKLNFH